MICFVYCISSPYRFVPPRGGWILDVCCSIVWYFKLIARKHAHTCDHGLLIDLCDELYTRSVRNINNELLLLYSMYFEVFVCVRFAVKIIGGRRTAV